MTSWNVILKSWTEEYASQDPELLVRHYRLVFSELRLYSRFKKQPREFFGNDHLRAAVVSFDALQEIRRFALKEVMTTILRENQSQNSHISQSKKSVFHRNFREFPWKTLKDLYFQFTIGASAYVYSMYLEDCTIRFPRTFTKFKHSVLSLKVMLMHKLL